MAMTDTLTGQGMKSLFKSDSGSRDSAEDSHLCCRFQVAGIDQNDQGLPGHHLDHLRQERFAHGALPGDDLLVIPEHQLFASHRTSPGQWPQSHCPV